MPKIYDNIENHLNEGLLKSLDSSYKADFCVGYFYLKGWKLLQDKIDNFECGKECCRLMIGMQRPTEEVIKEVIYHIDNDLMDNPKANVLKKEIAKSFKQQLTLGIPTIEDEKCLQKLKQQLLDKKVIVKLFLKHTLHAKLYLLHRHQEEPLKGYVGSSNLTLSGLMKQGELNVDVVEQDAAIKLSRWFNDRWDDRWAIDITKELIEVIDESWVTPTLPYYIYLKIAYHLSQEARSGINNYMIPKQLQDELLPFQANAVSVAARHLDKRGGVLISDVVGLGKTLTATAVAKLFEETFFTETLIICPKNLVEMWNDYKHKYLSKADVISISKINKSFIEKTRRYRVIIIDESHNLRNRQGKKYAIVKEYIEKNESRVILLTATPYNKTYLDISNQLRLFIPENKDIGIVPERFIEDEGGANEFVATYQYSPNTLLAFEKSHYSEDWQSLLSRYMVRRTRSFIKENYAVWDDKKQQHYIEFKDGRKNYFPLRIPKAVQYDFDVNDPTDIYVKLYSDDVVGIINSLHVARYGLGNYVTDNAMNNASKTEAEIILNLSRAGKRLMGFCRTNLFKRLESCGLSFLISLARHALKNQVFIYAIENNLPFPIGPQESAEMDEFIEEGSADETEEITLHTDLKVYREKAKLFYKHYQDEEEKYYWIDSTLFKSSLKRHLEEDINSILDIIKIGFKWNAKNDKQLNALYDLCTKTYKAEKVLVFTQFADTANYLYEQLTERKLKDVEVVTGAMLDPTSFAHRFSPVSNNKIIQDEIRVLITTDVLSEGQNLQDAHIVVNYDLPWAIIRLIQRAGRVDRIGQQYDKILCYSFLPNDGIERIIRLRSRLTTRITENSEVVGADETFFDGDPVNIRDLYNEKSGLLDNEDEGEVDLTSQAYEIWNQAIKANPELKKKIPALPDVVHSTKPIADAMTEGEGVISYHRNSHGFEALTWIGHNGKVISQSQSRILKAAECAIDTPALERMENHFGLVEECVKIAEKEAAQTGGQLGSKSGARYKTYMILQRYFESVRSTLFDTDTLKKTIDEVYKFPLRETAREMINRRFKLGVSDEELAEMTMRLREDGKLCVVDPNLSGSLAIPQIICSMGIKLNP